MNYKKKFDQLLDPSTSEQLIQFRHFLHQHPELSLQEIQTTQAIKAQLKKLQITEIHCCTPTGLIARIKGTDTNRPPIAIRADIDALPIQEKTNLPYQSKNKGVMHACGHDIHTTWLLAALHLLKKYPPKQDVIAIFQPAEEIVQGANIILKTGYLNDIKEIYGGHVDLNYEVGQVVIKDGAISANTSTFTITLQGKSAHIARPEQAISPLPCLAEIIQAIHQLNNHSKTNAARVIIGLGTIQAGTAQNISPENVHITGSIRSVNHTSENKTRQHIETLLKEKTTQHNLTYTINIQEGSPAIINDARTNKKASTAVKKALHKKAIVPLKCLNYAGEDFGFYAKKIPATFLRIGGRTANTPIIPAHNPYYQVDDDTIFAGALIWYQLCSIND